jgi:hypothetical protein
MEDTELTCSLLEEDERNMAIVKKGQVVFGSRKRGIGPFFRAVQRKGNNLHNAAADNRIMWLAARLWPFEEPAESCQEPSQLLTALESLFAEGEQ